MGIQIEGRPRYEPGQMPIVDFNFISPEYFQTLGIELRAGQPFSLRDGQNEPEAPKVAIINETIARRLFPDENPIGRNLLMGGPRTIVEVVGDTRHLGLDQEVRPEVYIPYLQGQRRPFDALTPVVRVASGQNNVDGQASLAAVIRKQVGAVDPNEPVNQGFIKELLD
jgi:putative ABC transport system permease protein